LHPPEDALRLLLSLATLGLAVALHHIPEEVDRP
jgi:hypothetical protein